MTQIKNRYELAHKLVPNTSTIAIGFWQQAYEAVISASLALNATLTALNITDKTKLAQSVQTPNFMRHLYKSFGRVHLMGFTGPLRFRDGDLSGSYVVDQIRAHTKKRVEHVAYLVAGQANITWVKPVVFADESSRAPLQYAPDILKHGITNKTYLAAVYMTITGGTLLLLIILGVIIISIIQRRLKRKLLKELYSMQWKIDLKEVVLVEKTTNTTTERPALVHTKTANFPEIDGSIERSTNCTPSAASQTLSVAPGDEVFFPSCSTSLVTESDDVAATERKISALSNDSGLLEDDEHADVPPKVEESKGRRSLMKGSYIGTYRGASIQLIPLIRTAIHTSIPAITNREKLLEVKTVSQLLKW